LSKERDVQPVKCLCGLWFATEKDLREHIEHIKVSFLTTKKIPQKAAVDFHKHGKSR